MGQASFAHACRSCGCPLHPVGAAPVRARKGRESGGQAGHMSAVTRHIRCRQSCVVPGKEGLELQVLLGVDKTLGPKEEGSQWGLGLGV